VDVAVVLLAHERLWEQRAVVLREWRMALTRREQVVRRRERHRVAMDGELARASGLTARQRAWAARHASYETRPRDRAGRQVVVTWTNHRTRIAATAARWAPILEADAGAIAEADATVAAAVTAVLSAWGPDAPDATGRTRRQLAAMARGRLPSA